MEGQMRDDIPDWVNEPPVVLKPPTLLFKGPRPRAVIMHADGQVMFGTEQQPMRLTYGLHPGDVAVRLLISLSITTESNVSLVFPATVRLERLAIDAVRVSLEFEDASVFASRLEDLIVRCSVRSREDKGAAQLAGHLEKRGLLLSQQSAHSVVGSKFGVRPEDDLGALALTHPCYELRVAHCIEGCKFDEGGRFEPSLPDLPHFTHAQGFPDAVPCTAWPGLPNLISSWIAWD
jgi:hypothetical protein